MQLDRPLDEPAIMPFSTLRHVQLMASGSNKSSFWFIRNKYIVVFWLQQKRTLAWLFKIALILAICWDESSTRAYNRNSQIVLGRWQTDVSSFATMQIRWRRSFFHRLPISCLSLFMAPRYPFTEVPSILQHILQLGTLHRKERVNKLTLNHFLLDSENEIRSARVFSSLTFPRLHSPIVLC